MSQPEIQRYDVRYYVSGEHYLHVSPQGEHVLHSDHLASKQADVKAIRGLRNALKNILDSGSICNAEQIAQKELEATKQYEEAAGERTE